MSLPVEANSCGISPLSPTKACSSDFLPCLQKPFLNVFDNDFHHPIGSIVALWNQTQFFLSNQDTFGHVELNLCGITFETFFLLGLFCCHWSEKQQSAFFSPHPLSCLKDFIWIWIPHTHVWEASSAKNTGSSVLAQCGPQRL